MRVAIHLRLSFAASGAAIGIISNRAAYFLLLFYSKVRGLDPVLAGLAMMLALTVDAVSGSSAGPDKHAQAKRQATSHQRTRHLFPYSFSVS